MSERKQVKIGEKWIGSGHPVYIIAEIGINHNGDIDIARQLIDVAAHAGCDAVKFQKRTPELCVPKEQRDVMRETPWGYISYMEYRERVEFGYADYEDLDSHCMERGIDWFVSCWDEGAVEFIEQFDPKCYKIQSAAVTDTNLLWHIRKTGRPIILSTGMSTMGQIINAVNLIGEHNLALCHSTSTYPCPPEELNLKMIHTLMEKFDVPVGYSGHEVGLVPSAAAVAMGACMVERHITLDRAMWGSDQSASVEPGGLERLVKYIRTVEHSMGDGIKQVYESEMKGMKRLRRNHENPSGDQIIFPGMPEKVRI